MCFRMGVPHVHDALLAIHAAWQFAGFVFFFFFFVVVRLGVRALGVERFRG